VSPLIAAALALHVADKKLEADGEAAPVIY